MAGQTLFISYVFFDSGNVRGASNSLRCMAAIKIEEGKKGKSHFPTTKEEKKGSLLPSPPRFQKRERAKEGNT